RMPKTLFNYVKHPFLKSPGKINVAETTVKHQLQKVFALIRNATGHDFSQYKQTTIRRRIERRLAVHQIDKLPDYIVYMQKNPLEIDALFKDLVIGVTSFFRDPEAYQVLEQKVLPNLLHGRKPDDPLRCWVVGCSTGEEAYSLAVIAAEAMEKLKKYLNVQIFATDIDEAAIENARKGIFPDSIAADISKERLDQFFTKDDGVFRVKKQIRDMVVFSLQSIIRDPPFSRLDLVSCRNLMIYLDQTLQKKIIPVFHYTLNPEGVLLLGTAETIGEFTDLFQPLNAKWKIFQRKESLREGIIDYPEKTTYLSQDILEPDDPTRLPVTTDLQALTEKAILSQFAPTGVLIDDKYEILHFVGRTEKFLVPPAGKPSFNILKMVREDLKFKLTAAIHKAVREKKRTDCKGVRVNYDNTFSMVDVSISPVTDKGLPPGLLLVLFEEKAPARLPDENTVREPGEKIKDPTVHKLEQELQSTREYLQATIEELETSNEELKSNNEEMQSVNEELQSTNEELETSKEELQSTNEELATVNSELQSKVNELYKASDDMNNLLAASEIASIFMDTRLNINRYTPAAARIIKLIPSDIGRPLSDLKTSFPGIDLAEHARKVLKDLNTLETEILSEDRIWHALKVLPYRTGENVIAGVVITVMDIHRVKQAEKIRRLATVLEDANDAIAVRDFKGRILAWNKGAEAMYGWTEFEALKMTIEDLIPKEGLKEEKALMDKLKKGEAVKALKTRRMTKGGKPLDVWLTATVLADESGRPSEIATTERDLAWFPE
ncbi:MAG: CheR family methyltransferase, partial [Desulfobacterales bacterium]